MSLSRDLRARLSARLASRLMVLVGTTLIVVSAGLGLLVVGFYAHRIATEQRAAADRLGGSLEAALDDRLIHHDPDRLAATLADLGREPAIGAVMLLSPARRVAFASDPARIGAELPPASAAPPGQTRTDRPLPNRPACASCHGSGPLAGHLVVDLVTADLRREALASAAGLAALGGLATLAASVMLALGMRRMVGPRLAALSGAVEAMGAGHAGIRVTPAGGDELAVLGEQFNRMAEGIEAGQEALARAEREAQALIDAIPDGIRVIGPDYRIRRANAAYAAQVGRPLSEIRGQFCYASSHGRSTPCEWTLVTCPVAEMARAPRPLTFRDRHQAPAGRQVAVEVSAAPLGGRAADGGALVVEAIRDLDAETRISHSQRLSELGLLATGVAHEIHNPLSAVELALTALHRDLSRGRAETASEYVALIRGEIARCLDITDNLLRLGSPSGEGRQLLDLDAIAAGVMRLLAWQAEAAGVVVRQAIPPGLRVVMAESDLRMALTNLALNAIHAMPQGGTLTLAAHRAAAGDGTAPAHGGHGVVAGAVSEGPAPHSQPAGPGRIVLSVTDTGVGIAPGDLGHIFMPFWSRRADATTGRGLGLAITRAIVDRAGATIQVESTPGAGSRFTLSFPDADAETETLPDPAP